MNYGELKQIFRELKRASPRDNLTAHIIFKRGQRKNQAGACNGDQRACGEW